MLKDIFIVLNDKFNKIKSILSKTIYGENSDYCNIDSVDFVDMNDKITFKKIILLLFKSIIILIFLPVIIIFYLFTINEFKKIFKQVFVFLYLFFFSIFIYTLFTGNSVISNEEVVVKIIDYKK